MYRSPAPLSRALSFYWYNSTLILNFKEHVLKLIKTYAPLALIAAVIIPLDQWTKWLVRENIPFAMQWLPEGWEWLMPYARLVYWHNSGSAFGLFQGFGGVFGVLAVIVAGVIVYYYPQVPAEDWWLRLAMGMQLSGALGNLIDRLTVGEVTDFISIGTFPVWNVADASITMGVVILVIGMGWKEYRESKKAKTEGGTGESDPAGDGSSAEIVAGSGTGASE